MAERLVSVDTGGTGDYTSLSAAITGEAAISSDLVADGDNLVIEVEASTGVADTTSAELSAAWVTSESNDIVIRAKTGDTAVKTGISASIYRLVTTGGHGLTIRTDYVTVDGLQVQPVGASIYGIQVPSGATTALANYIHIKNCYLQGDQSSGQRTIYMPDANAVGKIENTVASDGSDCIFISGDIDIYNCVVLDAVNDGIEYESGATGTVKNCASFSNGTDFDIDGGATVTIDYCASDDGSGTNPLSPSGADWVNEFPNYATGNVTIVNTGNLWDGGVGPAVDSEVPTVDIEGTTRSGSTCSVGIDEYAGVVPPTGIAILRRRRMIA